MARLTERPRRTRGDATPDGALTSTDVASRPQVATASPQPPRRRLRPPRTFDSFHNREFRWFYISMLGQMAAMNMQMIVRPYLAYELTKSYAVLGLVSLVSAVPMLFLAVFGGVVADRLPRKTVLQVGQFASAVNAGALAILAFTGLIAMEWLYVSALLQGIVMALMMPTRQAMIPDIVGMDRMMNAVSLNMAGMNTMRLFAPAMGGFIIGFAGFGWAFAAMTGLYGLAMVALVRITREPATAPGPIGESPLEVARSSISDIGAGLRYIRFDRVMLALLSLSFVSAMFAMPYQFLLPGYVADIFGGGGPEVGVLMSISAIGALAGALVLASIPNRRRGQLLLAGSVVLGVGLVIFTRTDNYWLGAVFLMIVGLGSAFRQGLTQGLIHANVENVYRGRVMSVFMTQMSVMQLSTFVVGVVAEFVGIQTALAGLGVGLVLVVALYGVFVPSIRRLD